jgi:hypothetical protein
MVEVARENDDVEAVLPEDARPVEINHELNRRVKRKVSSASSIKLKTTPIKRFLTNFTNTSPHFCSLICACCPLSAVSTLSPT